MFTRGRQVRIIDPVVIIVVIIVVIVVVIVVVGGSSGILCELYISIATLPTDIMEAYVNNGSGLLEV